LGVASILGQSIIFHPSGDPPGFWAFSSGDQVLVDIGWSSYERAVRIEATDGVWRVHFGGWRTIRCVVEGPEHQARLWYAGGLLAGVAEVLDGRRFELFTQRDLKHGRWSGIDDEWGDGVVRATGHIGIRGVWSEVHITPEPRHADLVWPLLYLSGGLRILKQRNPLARLLALLQGADQTISRLMAPLAKGPSEGWIS
jgi:hypothetical protein